MSEDVKIFCPNCGQHLLIDGSMVGNELECPTCKQTFKALRLSREEEAKDGTDVLGSSQSALNESDKEGQDPMSQSINPTPSSNRPTRVSRSFVVHSVSVVLNALAFSWKKVFHPIICFCAASCWFFMRSMAWLVAKSWRFVKAFVLSPLAKRVNVAGSKVFSEFSTSKFGLGLRSGWRWIRLFIQKAVEKPLQWLWNRVVLPIDLYWKTSEARRMGLADDGSAARFSPSNVPLGRRIAYVGVGGLVACFVISQLSDPSDGQSTASSEFSSYAATSRNAQSGIIDMSGWPQWRKEAWTGTSAHAAQWLRSNKIDMNEWPQWKQDIWNNPVERSRWERMHKQFCSPENLERLRRMGEDVQRAQQARWRAEEEQRQATELAAWKARIDANADRVIQQQQDEQKERAEKRRKEHEDWRERHAVWHDCRHCGGSGSVSPGGGPCHWCRGFGKIKVMPP